jgi:hypothetical protein
LFSLLCLCLFFNKIVIRAEQDLPGTKGVGGRRWGRGQGREMTQTMYAHMNKRIIKKKNNSSSTLGPVVN